MEPKKMEKEYVLYDTAPGAKFKVGTRVRINHVWHFYCEDNSPLEESDIQHGPLINDEGIIRAIHLIVDENEGKKSLCYMVEIDSNTMLGYPEHELMSLEEEPVSTEPEAMPNIGDVELAVKNAIERDAGKNLVTKDDFLSKLLDSVSVLRAVQNENARQNVAIENLIQSLVQQMGAATAINMAYKKEEGTPEEAPKPFEDGHEFGVHIGSDTEKQVAEKNKKVNKKGERIYAKAKKEKSIF